MENNTLSELFRARFGAMPESVTPLPPSGSHRKYFRLEGTGLSTIGVEGTDPAENRAFCYLAQHFLGKGIDVPEVYALSENGMCYLQEDLGRVSLFDFLSGARQRGFFSDGEKNLLVKSVSGLAKIQFEGVAGLDFSRTLHPAGFDGTAVMFDLNYFKYCFLKLSGMEFDEMRLQDDFERLRDDICSVPATTFMYRDFQSRNVMLKDGEPYYIDFQGGMRGPLYYDLASFVWQARAGYPEELKELLIQAYMDAASRYTALSPGDFRSSLRLFVLMRTLQVLGAYGFRGYFEKKEHFLKSIPAAIANLDELLSVPFGRYPYLDSVLRRLVAGYGRKQVRTEPGGPALTVTVYSFSYRKGIPEDASGNGGGYVFDCRYIHNPGKYDCYKSLTGMDAPVVKFLEDDGEVFRFMDNVYALVDAHVSRFLERGFTHLMVSFGCTGGQHRSVYCAGSLARHLAGRPGVKVELIHREQGVRRTF